MLYPQLRYVLNDHSELKCEGILGPHDGHELAGALLSSSRVFLELDGDWKYSAIPAAKELLDQQPCEGPLAVEDQYLMRLTDERQSSLKGESVTPVTVTDPRSNAQQGEIILSIAYRLLKAENQPAALRELDKFTPFDDQHSKVELLL